MKYFENFPLIEYEGRRVRDISRRTNFVKAVSNNPYLYYPYTVAEGDLRVIRPFVYVRERAIRAFAEGSKLPVIAENCPG